MRTKRKIVHIDEEKCNGCGQCVGACAEGAIVLLNGKARLVEEKYCDGLAACLGECPVNAISIIERESDPFDPEAVERYLTGQKGAGTSTLPCGCPSTQLQMFSAPRGCAAEDATKTPSRTTCLTHWPVQIKLVPTTAPFLKNADLLVASDCTSVACPNFHEDLLKGRAVMMGCPKFDDTGEYIDKFMQIFSTANVKSVTIAIMEVPCCSKMPMIVEQAMKQAGVKIPVEIVAISARGEIVSRTALAA